MCGQRYVILLALIGCEVHCLFFLQAEDGILVLVRSRGLGDVYKRQSFTFAMIHRMVL